MVTTVFLKKSFIAHQSMLQALVIVLFFLLVGSCGYSRPETTRASYSNIDKIEVDLAYKQDITYTLQTNKNFINALVTDINSLRKGRWHEVPSGKEGSARVMLTIFRNGHAVKTFTFFSGSFLEASDDYRQLRVKGYSRSFDISKTPALRQLWCQSPEAKNFDNFNKVCKS